MRGSKISVIVPAYNVENYIENAVKSICNQSYRNLEIILVDDGSKDKTPAILDKLANTDDRIIVIHKENGGVTSARLRGVEVATGNWIGFMDGDDYIEPQMYEMLLNNALRYKADISHCGYQMVFPSRVDSYYGTGRIVQQDYKSGIKDLLEGIFVEPGLWNKLFRGSLLKQFQKEAKMDLSIKNNEDLLMNFYLFSQAERSVFEDQCPYHYLVRKGSAATGSMNHNKLQDPLKVLKILEYEAKNDAEISLIVGKRIISQLINLSTMCLRGEKNLIKPYRDAARKELRERFKEIWSQEYSIKQKVMTIWVIVWPWSYGMIHTLYSKVTGIDRKYEVS